MIKWLKELFLGKPKPKKLPKRKIYPIETYKCCDEHTLKRQRIEDIELPVGDWRWGGNCHKLYQYRYWCLCSMPLTEGPSGGVAVNAVCEKCRTNYGNLPGYWGE